MTVLLIENNNGLGSAIVQELAIVRLVVEWKRRFDDARELAIDPNTDLIILDRALPDADGLDIVRHLRGEGIATPILMVSSRTAVPDRVAGLDAGADDYLVKPFAFAELAARCRALLRRPRLIETEPVNLGNLVLRPDTLELTIDGRAMTISRREGQLLLHLLRRPGRVCTRTYLEGLLYDPAIAVSPNALETSISRLRSLLAGASAQVELKTVRGVGYVLAVLGV